jgi:predicted  nucleic acid-binding Zn-ribbon protein
MKNPMENLLDLQNLEFQSDRRSPETEQEIEALRKKIPESLLTKFDRWIARGRKAVAVARNGVCSECHIGLAIGVVGALAFGDDIQSCGNCGRFLYLPESEPLFGREASVNAKPARAGRRKKESPAHAR